MHGTHGKRPRALARLAAALAIVAATGLAGAAQLRLEYTNLAGGTTGDGAQATAANLVGAHDIVFDSAGNLYVSQLQGNRIRKITPSGVISTVAGGQNGFGGDGGAASKALIDRPAGLAIDASGNLYFADTANRRVRRIAPNGTITTVAGNGLGLDGGDGGPATSASFADVFGLAVDKNGNLFVSERTTRRIRKITPAGTISRYAGTGAFGAGGDSGQAVNATFRWPYGIDVDAAGNLYIADGESRNVRRVGTNGVITTFASGLVHPYNVRVDKSGNVFVADDCRIHKYNASGTKALSWGKPTELCQRSMDGTLATEAGFGVVNGMEFDAEGNGYFVDDFERIAIVYAFNKKLHTLAGVSPHFADGASAATAPMMAMSAVAVADSGAVLVADVSARKVRSIAAGKVATIAGNESTLGGCTGDCGVGTGYSLRRTTALATAPGGVTYVADRVGLLRIAPGNSYIGWSDGPDAENARAVATDLAGMQFVAEYAKFRIIRLGDSELTQIAGGADCTAFNEGGLALDACIRFPSQLTMDGGGGMYVYDELHAIRKIGRDGRIRRIAGNGEAGAFAGEGGPALNARLGVVESLAVHPSGVYFTSEGRLRRVRPDTRVETIAFPYYAAGVAAKFGKLYIATQIGRVLRATLPRAVAPSDFDGDGRSDVLFRSTTGANLAWLGANSATKLAVATMATEQKLAGQGDFDGDGEADLVWRNTLTGANTIWRSGNVNTQLVVATVADQDWTIAGVGDFNGDGRDDLFWRNKVTGANEYWPGATSSAKRAVSAQLDLKWVVAGIGDFDGDGRADALWRNTQTGANRIWPGLLSSQWLALAAVTNPAWKVAAIGDFNGDGASDVVWRDPATGGSAIWRSANSAWRQSIVAVTGTQWSIAAAGDYDNDGIDDLLWRNNITGENTIWKSANSAIRKPVATAGTSWKVQPFEGQQ
jgi:hypothetical protein